MCVFFFDSRVPPMWIGDILQYKCCVWGSFLRRKFGSTENTCGPLRSAKFYDNSSNESPLRCEKPQNRHLNAFNKG